MARLAALRIAMPRSVLARQAERSGQRVAGQRIREADHARAALSLTRSHATATTRLVKAALFVVASATCVALVSPIAHADDPVAPTGAAEPDGPPDIIRRAATALEEGRYAEARELFTTAYQLTPVPKVLFALGQCEFNLNNFAAAIDYYQRFLDSNPEPREAALAQQAIGAARARLAAPPPRVIERERPAPTYERDWDVWSTSLVSVGGAAAITGTIVLVHGFRMGREVRANETAVLYQQRLDRSKRWQWRGLGVAAAGTAIVAAALVRFAVHRVEVAPIAPGPSPGSMGLAVGRSW